MMWGTKPTKENANFLPVSSTKSTRAAGSALEIVLMTQAIPCLYLGLPQYY